MYRHNQNNCPFVRYAIYNPNLSFCQQMAQCGDGTELVNVDYSQGETAAQCNAVLQRSDAFHFTIHRHERSY